MPLLKERNHPVIIGVGQITHRKKIEGNSLSAADLAVMAIDDCVLNTGQPDIRPLIDSISVVNIISEFRESPVEKICVKAGISPTVREETAMGGNNPQLLVNRAAEKIMAGERKICLLVGAEALYRDQNVWDFIDFESHFRRMKKIL